MVLHATHAHPVRHCCPSSLFWRRSTPSRRAWWRGASRSCGWEQPVGDVGLRLALHTADECSGFLFARMCHCAHLLAMRCHSAGEPAAGVRAAVQRQHAAEAQAGGTGAAAAGGGHLPPAGEPHWPCCCASAGWPKWCAAGTAIGACLLAWDSTHGAQQSQLAAGVLDSKALLFPAPLPAGQHQQRGAEAADGGAGGGGAAGWQRRRGH